MKRQMAHPDLIRTPDDWYGRPLLDLIDRQRGTPPLTRRESVRLVTGYAIATLVVLGFVLLLGLAH